MPGNRLNSTSGRPILAVALRNDHVIGERVLEPAAQGVALNQSDRQQGQPHLGQVLVHRIDTGIGVAAQVRGGACADEPCKQGEIAAQIPDPRESRAPDDGAYRQVLAQRCRRKALPQAILQSADLIEQPRREARALGMVDHAPQGVVLRLEPNGQLVELFIETMRVKRTGIGAMAVFRTAPPDEVLQSRHLAVLHRGGVRSQHDGRAGESLLGDRHDCLSSTFGLMSVARSFGLSRSHGVARAAALPKRSSGLLDRAGTELYQASIESLFDYLCLNLRKLK